MEDPLHALAAAHPSAAAAALPIGFMLQGAAVQLSQERRREHAQAAGSDASSPSLGPAASSVSVAMPAHDELLAPFASPMQMPVPSPLQPLQDPFYAPALAAPYHQPQQQPQQQQPAHAAQLEVQPLLAGALQLAPPQTQHQSQPQHLPQHQSQQQQQQQQPEQPQPQHLPQHQSQQQQQQQQQQPEQPQPQHQAAGRPGKRPRSDSMSPASADSPPSESTSPGAAAGSTAGSTAGSRAGTRRKVNRRADYSQSHREAERSRRQETKRRLADLESLTGGGSRRQVDVLRDAASVIRKQAEENALLRSQLDTLRRQRALAPAVRTMQRAGVPEELTLMSLRERFIADGSSHTLSANVLWDSSFSVCIFGPDLRVVAFNPEFSRRGGFDRGDIARGMSIAEIVPPRRLATSYRVLGAMMRGECPARMVLRAVWLSKTGRIRSHCQVRFENAQVGMPPYFVSMCSEWETIRSESDPSTLSAIAPPTDPLSANVIVCSDTGCTQ